MKIGVFQRLCLTVVLIGTMLMPFGTCLQAKHKTAHSCCAPASETGKTAKANCCVVRDQQPAVIVVPSLPSSAPMAVDPEFISTNVLSSPREVSVVVFIPPLSPPTGAFNLRI
jgi:hypothetical protein